MMEKHLSWNSPNRQTHFVQQVWVRALQNHPGDNSSLVLLKAPLGWDFLLKVPLGCTQGPPAVPPAPRNTGTAFPGCGSWWLQLHGVPSPPLQPFLCRRCSPRHQSHTLSTTEEKNPWKIPKPPPKSHYLGSPGPGAGEKSLSW